MIAPRGFGKNYFKLSSILAYSTEVKLHSQIQSIESLIDRVVNKSDRESESPPDILELTNSLNSDKPCYCNSIFKLKTLLAIGIYEFIPRCPHYCTYFAFRRTGVHPPTT